MPKINASKSELVPFVKIELASKNKFAEGHSRGPRTAGLDLLQLEPVVLSFQGSLFYCSLLSRLSLVCDKS